MMASVGPLPLDIGVPVPSPSEPGDPSPTLDVSMPTPMSPLLHGLPVDVAVGAVVTTVLVGDGGGEADVEVTGAGSRLKPRLK
jgi:hypothetical protein